MCVCVFTWTYIAIKRGRRTALRLLCTYPCAASALAQAMTYCAAQIRKQTLYECQRIRTNRGSAVAGSASLTYIFCSCSRARHGGDLRGGQRKRWQVDDDPNNKQAGLGRAAPDCAGISSGEKLQPPGRILQPNWQTEWAAQGGGAWGAWQVAWQSPHPPISNSTSTFDIESERVRFQGFWSEARSMNRMILMLQPGRFHARTLSLSLSPSFAAFWPCY